MKLGAHRFLTDAESMLCATLKNKANGGLPAIFYSQPGRKTEVQLGKCVKYEGGLKWETEPLVGAGSVGDCLNECLLKEW